MLIKHKVYLNSKSVHRTAMDGCITGGPTVILGVFMIVEVLTVVVAMFWEKGC